MDDPKNPQNNEQQQFKLEVFKLKKRKKCSTRMCDLCGYLGISCACSNYHRMADVGGSLRSGNWRIRWRSKLGWFNCGLLVRFKRILKGRWLLESKF